MSVSRGLYENHGQIVSEHGKFASYISSRISRGRLMKSSDMDIAYVVTSFVYIASGKPASLTTIRREAIVLVAEAEFSKHRCVIENLSTVHEASEISMSCYDMVSPILI